MAIAYVEGTSGGAGATNALTITTFTISSGSNLCLVVGAAANDGVAGDRDVSSITWNGVALTKGAESDDTAEFDNTEIWFLLNPDTGNHNLVVTCGGTCTIISAVVAVYSGVKQTGQPDATDVEDEASAASTTSTITTVADNSMIVSHCVCHNQARSIDSLTGGNIRVNGDVGTAYDSAIGDILTTSAGAQTVTWNFGGGNSAAQQANISLAPDTGGATSTNCGCMSLGVG